MSCGGSRASPLTCGNTINTRRSMRHSYVFNEYFNIDFTLGFFVAFVCMDLQLLPSYPTSALSSRDGFRPPQTTHLQYFLRNSASRALRQVKHVPESLRRQTERRARM